MIKHFFSSMKRPLAVLRRSTGVEGDLLYFLKKNVQFMFWSCVTLAANN